LNLRSYFQSTRALSRPMVGARRGRPRIVCHADHAHHAK
jgi:hypothetical protein